MAQPRHGLHTSSPWPMVARQRASTAALSKSFVDQNGGRGKLSRLQFTARLSNALSRHIPMPPAAARALTTGLAQGRGFPPGSEA